MTSVTGARAAPRAPPGWNALKSSAPKPRRSRSATASASPTTDIIVIDVVGALVIAQASLASGSVTTTLARRARRPPGLARDQRNGHAGRRAIAGQIVEFARLSRFGEEDHPVVAGDHAEVAVACLGSMDELSRRTGGGERRGDLARHVRALADAGKHHTSADRVDHFDEGDELTPERLAQTRQSVDLGVDDSAGRVQDFVVRGQSSLPAHIRAKSLNCRKGLVSDPLWAQGREIAACGACFFDTLGECGHPAYDRRGGKLSLFYDLAVWCISAVYYALFTPFARPDEDHFRWFRRRLRPELPAPGRRRPVWIHGVSLGETKVSALLASAIAARAPGLPVVVSSSTRAGYARATAIPGIAGAFVLPIDTRAETERVFDQLDPAVLVVIESEMWPNLFHVAARHGVPIIIANAIMSDLSFRQRRRLPARVCRAARRRQTCLRAG